MSGITGIFNLDNTPVNSRDAGNMTSVIKHRGRDDEGYIFINTDKKSNKCAGGRDTPEAVWKSSYIFSPKFKVDNIDAASGGYNLVIGQKLLADFDLSAAGHQPLGNEDGTIWLASDSEIYNYPELKEKLTCLGHSFISNSDTEVIVHAYEQWGFDCLQEFNGVWAFVLFDASKKVLFCACDRFCLKPFYYYFNNRVFIFASEIKALLEHPDVPRKKNDEVIHNYLLWGFSSYSEATFFKDIYRLKPSHYLIIGLNTEIKQDNWWRPEVNSAIGSYASNEETAQKKLLFLVEDAIKLRLSGNLPAGFFLSGGLDSSTIVCLSHRLIRDNQIDNNHLLSNKLRTFSSCIKTREYNEIAFIESVIRETGAEKNYIFPDGNTFWEDLPALIRHQEEPFTIGSPIFAQWATIQLASNSGIKVLHDGQGGDEIFAGYDNYFGTYLINLLFRCNFRTFLREVSQINGVLSNKQLNELIIHIVGSSVFKTMPITIQSAFEGIALRLRGRISSHLFNNSFHQRHKKQGLILYREYSNTIANLQNKLLSDSMTTLVNLLRIGERNSMAFSVLLRNPLLDHRIVEYVFSLPASYKIRDGWTKWILRQSMKDILPGEVYLRKTKLGFPTPQTEWLLQNKDRIIALFNSPDVCCNQYINTEYFIKNIDKLIRWESRAWEIWQLITFELWLRAYFK